MNISSIIIKSKDIESTAQKLAKINSVEIALKEDSTIIAVIEAESTEMEVSILKQIESVDGVISAQMHYCYFEDELSDEIKNMDFGVPKILNDNTPIEKVRYSGSVDYMMKKEKSCKKK